MNSTTQTVERANDYADFAPACAPVPAHASTLPRAFGFSVPHWARWAAVDQNGTVWAFACEPTRMDARGVWHNEDLGGRMDLIGDFGVDRLDGWHHSLLRLDGDRWVPAYITLVDASPAPEAEADGDWRATLAMAVLLALAVAAAVLAKTLHWLP